MRYFLTMDCFSMRFKVQPGQQAASILSIGRVMELRSKSGREMMPFAWPVVLDL